MKSRQDLSFTGGGRPKNLLLKGIGDARSNAVRKQQSFIKLNHRKTALTLGEILISIAIVGILMAILIPIIRLAKPSETEALHKKATNIVERVVNELSSDEYLYPQTNEYSGLSSVSAVTVNGQTHSGNTKFCTLFASRINTKPGTQINCIPNEVSVTSIEGIDWYLPISNFQNGAETLMVDVNGAEAPNTLGIDRFEYKINPGVKIPVVEVPRIEATAPPPPRPEIIAPPNVNNTKNGLESYSISCNGTGAMVYGNGDKKVNGNYTLVAIPNKGYKCNWFTKQVTVKDANVTDCALTCTPDTLRPTLDGEPIVPPPDDDDGDDDEKTYCINVTMTGEADKCTVSGAGCNKINGQYIVKISSKDSSKYSSSWSEKSVIIKDSDVNLTAECAGKKYVSWQKTFDSSAEGCPQATVFQNKIIYDKCAGCADASVQLLDPSPKVEVQNMNANGVRGLYVTTIREDTSQKTYRYKLIPPANAEVQGSDIYTITYGSCNSNEKCYNINVTGDIENCPVKLPEGSCKTDKNKYSNGKYELVITPKSGYWYNGADKPYTASLFIVGSDANYNVVCQKAPAKKYVLTINYVNKNGEQIHAPQTFQYIAGDTYKIEYPQITGYKAPSGALTGTMPDKDLTLTVVYEAEAVNATVSVWFSVLNIAYKNTKGTVTLTPTNGGNSITVSLDGIAPGYNSYKEVVVPAGTYNVTTSSDIQILLHQTNSWASVKNITVKPASITLKPGGTGEISVKADYQKVTNANLSITLQFNITGNEQGQACFVNKPSSCTVTLRGPNGTISETFSSPSCYTGGPNGCIIGSGGGGWQDLPTGTYTLSDISCSIGNVQAQSVSNLYFDYKSISMGSSVVINGKYKELGNSHSLRGYVGFQCPSSNKYSIGIKYVDEAGNAILGTFSLHDYVEAGKTYSYTSPVLEGYTPDKVVVYGTMPARNVEIIVTYRKN